MITEITFRVFLRCRMGDHELCPRTSWLRVDAHADCSCSCHQDPDVLAAEQRRKLGTVVE